MNSTRSKQFLVIEDNEICQKIYNITFKQLNCPLSLVGTAKEAIRLVNQFRYDCILADWGLPDCEEDYLLKALRASTFNKTTPLYVISAQVSQELIDTCQALGVQGVYSKPFSPKEIQALIRSYF